VRSRSILSNRTRVTRRPSVSTSDLIAWVPFNRLMHGIALAVADGAAAARGCDASVNFSPIANGSPFPRVEYPPTINDARVAAFASDVASEMFGEAVVDRNVAAVMPAEDFSFFARRWPSVMMWLGSYNVSAGATHPLHSSKYVLDEGVLHRGVAMHVGFAVRYLEAGES